MSGAPGARYFDVQIAGSNGEVNTQRYTLEAKILSDTTINRLRAVLMKRRRELRQQAIKDFSEYGRDLPQETKAAFAKEILADAKSDAEISVEQISGFMESMDEEALATLLWTCSPEITSFDEARKVLAAHGNPLELFEVLGDLLQEESKSAGNLPRHPVKE